MKGRISAVVAMILAFVAPSYADNPYRARVTGSVETRLTVSTPEGRHVFVFEEVSSDIYSGDDEARSGRYESGRYFKGRQVRPMIAGGVNPRAAADIAEGLLRVNFFGRRTGRPYLLEVELSGLDNLGRLSHVSSFFSHSCATHDSLSSLPSLGQPTTSLAIVKRELNISLDADYLFYKALGGSARGKKKRSANLVKSEVQSIVNRVNSIYSDQLGITLRINSLIVDNGNKRSVKSRNSSRVLNKFREFTVKNNTLKKADVYHLFTGNSFAGSVVGLAYVGATCRTNLGNYAFGLSRLTNPSVQALVTAHEIAHNLGATHADGDRSIMSPVLTAHNNSFIISSINQIFIFIQEFGSCVTQVE